MRLIIGARDHGAGLATTNYVSAKRIMREFPVSILQVVQPLPSRENLIGFLSWCNGRHCLPLRVVLNQVSPEDRRLAMQYLIARGYRTADRVTFMKL
ncbi:hypothetical protein AWR36_002160 [Microbulbifer flavimaris]|uniref:Uncharacterized protein n=1 Tax=Microbulbifer flavimaris TaxID=1781068 RepID=A0ABX4I4Z5_9GAMM|nr:MULTISPECIES: hypothetical protein [Microbulbifer]KUJ84502.1 hypothetical protein AVO43_02165 [Microbulbifer sp. ZGT114]PCO06589.1 hypothetical protein AWR36_002160 [Microbulbifer flavimaris]